MDANQMVERYRQLRSIKKKGEEMLREKMKPVNDEMRQIEGDLLAEMTRLGVTSLKGDNGTAYQTTRENFSVRDWPALLEYVKEEDGWALLGHSVNPTSVREFVEGLGELPPGVHRTAELKVNIRK